MAAVASPAMRSAQAQQPKPAQIDRNGVLILMRTTLLALDQANKTGNYTVLRDLGAPGFQVNTAARLGEIFAEQRSDNLDLSGVAVIDPQLTLLPQIEANGMMRMAGFFPSVPTQVNFELAFAPVDGQWRLFGISVSLGQAAPTAPTAPAAVRATRSRRRRAAKARRPRDRPRRPPVSPGKMSQPQQRPSPDASRFRAEIDERDVRDALLHLGGHHELCGEHLQLHLRRHASRPSCILHLHSESLITRGRNKIVLKFLSEE